MNCKRRFTLAELLMVITIIAILMAIILPGIHIAKKKAKVVKARAEIQSLLTSIKMYESTYGYLPTFTAAADVTESGVSYDRLISILSQTGSYTTSGNSRGIKMLDVTRDGVFQDPWKNDYWVMIDANYDGQIDAAGAAEAPGLADDAYSSILIWSTGPDGLSNSGSNSHASNRDNIYSVPTNWNTANGHKVQ